MVSRLFLGLLGVFLLESALLAQTPPIALGGPGHGHPDPTPTAIATFHANSPIPRATFDPITTPEAKKMENDAKISKLETYYLGLGHKEDEIPQLRPTVSAQMRELADRLFVDGESPKFVEDYNAQGPTTAAIANALADKMDPIPATPSAAAAMAPGSAQPYGLNIPIPTDPRREINNITTANMGALRNRMNTIMGHDKGLFGVEFGVIVDRVIDDFTKQFLSSDFWDCWDLRIRGVCWEFGFGCGGHRNAACLCALGTCLRLDAMRQYNWSVQQFASAANKAQDFYTVKPLADKMFDVGEEMYSLMRPTTIQGNALITELATKGTGYVASVIPGAMDAGSLKHADIKVMGRDITDEQADKIKDIPREFRASNSNDEGSRVIHNRVFRSWTGELARTILGSIPVLGGFGPCHNNKNFFMAAALPMWSEGSLWSVFTKPLDTSVMASSILHPNVGEFTKHIGFSLGCPIFNTMQPGLAGDELSKPGADLVFGPTGIGMNELFNRNETLSDMRNSTAKKCGRGNQGYMGQVTSASPSTDKVTPHEEGLHHAADMIDGLVKLGNNAGAASFLTPASYYYEFNREKDKVQYLAENPLRRINGGKCKKFTYDKMRYEEEFSQEEQKVNPLANIEGPEGLVAHWREFKCCYNSNCMGSCDDTNTR